MITQEKLNMYEKYSGNIESWDRFGKKKDKEVMSYEEWEMIDRLIQDLELIEKGLASESFEAKTFEKLKQVCDSEETIEELKSLTGKFQ